MVGPADSQKNPLWDLKMCALNAQSREYIQQRVMFPWLYDYITSLMVKLINTNKVLNCIYIGNIVVKCIFGRTPKKTVLTLQKN